MDIKALKLELLELPANLEDEPPLQALKRLLDLPADQAGGAPTSRAQVSMAPKSSPPLDVVAIGSPVLVSTRSACLPDPAIHSPAA